MADQDRIQQRAAEIITKAQELYRRCQADPMGLAALVCPQITAVRSGCAVRDLQRRDEALMAACLEHVTGTDSPYRFEIRTEFSISGHAYPLEPQIYFTAYDDTVRIVSWQASRSFHGDEIMLGWSDGKHTVLAVTPQNSEKIALLYELFRDNKEISRCQR